MSATPTTWLLKDTSAQAAKKYYVSTDQRLIDQLPDGLRGRYPVVTSHNSACDRAVVGLMRGRTLGNSPTALSQAISERHSEEY